MQTRLVNKLSDRAGGMQTRLVSKLSVFNAQPTSIVISRRGKTGVQTKLPASHMALKMPFRIKSTHVLSGLTSKKHLTNCGRWA